MTQYVVKNICPNRIVYSVAGLITFWRQSQIKAIAAKSSNGSIAIFTDDQPYTTDALEQFINQPEPNEAAVTLPKTKRSFRP